MPQKNIRKEVVRVRFNEEEKQRLQKLAKELNLTVSELIRFLPAAKITETKLIIRRTN